MGKFKPGSNIVTCRHCGGVTHTSYIFPLGCGISSDEFGWRRGCLYDSLSPDEKDSVDHILSYYHPTMNPPITE